ncbi:MAG: bis(5'-nucleosyl)-tetraphosphatase (symmetrical) YqeK [Clostridiales bacterium]|nr:bis(5'-nucleosyl)-tetraphosphatase (symmetrical) YqeK [Clostridiales bacterium]
MKYKEIKAEIKTLIKPSRYEHTKGVIKTARHLAEIYGADEKQVKLAALLHDCAKYMSDDEKIHLCGKYGVKVSEAEMKNPGLLHAKCGAIVARHKFKVKDVKVLHAIAVHTTGVPGMNLLDQIIFVSDYIEPGRCEAPHLDRLREIAVKDLDQATYLILRDTVNYLNTLAGHVTDPTTANAYKYYKNICGQ